LSEEQLAAVEALTRGLVNKFLHPPMQALKQAARENDAVRLESLCETWSLPSSADREDEPKPPATEPAAAPKSEPVAATEKAERGRVSETSGAGRR
jgi:glutamyl-tRNA reductase